MSKYDIPVKELRAVRKSIITGWTVDPGGVRWPVRKVQGERYFYGKEELTRAAFDQLRDGLPERARGERN